MLTCIASDVRDRVRNRGPDNVTNINTRSVVRRIIFKRPQCMYKSEQRYINESLLIRNALARTHTVFLWLFSRDNLNFQFAFSPHIQTASDQSLQCVLVGISIKDSTKMNYYTDAP